MPYRGRLRREGGTLALCGVAGSALLLATTAQATRGPLSTVVQLAVVAALLAALGPRATRRAMDRARLLARGDAGAGEPTPLWQLPLVVAGLSAAFGLLAGWDAGLRVTGGCALVGLAQAVLLERVVAARERRDGVVFVRQPGSRILRGTVLGAVPR